MLLYHSLGQFSTELAIASVYLSKRDKSVYVWSRGSHLQSKPVSADINAIEECVLRFRYVPKLSHATGLPFSEIHG